MDLDSKPDYFLAEEPEPAKPVIKFEEEAATPPAPDKPQPKKRHRVRRFFIWLLVIIAVALGAVVWVRYFNPYETDMQEHGYVVDFKRQGVVFKTWEGQMIVQSALVDSTRPYSRDFVFSVDNDAVAATLAAAKGTGREVTVTYKRFWGVIPWRGATGCIVTSVTFDGNHTISD